MAEHAEIIDEIEALAVHCRAPIMSVEARHRWAVDWATDLAKYPIEAIRNAFRNWRNGDNGKFPTPGQIMPAIRAQVPNAPSERVEAWRPLGEAEYQSLSLNEKIRHHRISAADCRRQAGPQWRDGRPCPAEQMSSEWGQWRQRATNHDAEAQRLQNTVNRLDERA